MIWQKGREDMARRRANNEGTIFYREARRKWVGEVSLDGRRLTKYSKSQREIRDWVKETLVKISNGLTFEGTQVTLRTFMETWLDGKDMSSRPKTVNQYRMLATQHILPRLGNMRLTEIQPAHLKQLYLSKKEEGRGARTVQMIHTLMHTVLKQAMKEGILGRNPAAAVERPKVERIERHILTEEQARQLVIAATGTRYGTLIFMALMTGMREGELLGLKWEDVDWVKGQLFVQRQLQSEKGNGSGLVPPKTKAGIRHIKLSPGTVDRLVKHREEQKVQKEFNRTRWEENDLIFPNTIGKPMSCRNMYVEYKRLLRENGLPDINFHALRHTALSFLLDMGTPVNTVQKWAGHSKASVTTDTYGHSLAHAETEAAVRLEELISPIPVDVKLLSK
jgi:integrase